MAGPRHGLPGSFHARGMFWGQRLPQDGRLTGSELAGGLRVSGTGLHLIGACRGTRSEHRGRLMERRLHWHARLGFSSQFAGAQARDSPRGRSGPEKRRWSAAGPAQHQPPGVGPQSRTNQAWGSADEPRVSSGSGSQRHGRSLWRLHFFFSWQKPSQAQSLIRRGAQPGQGGGHVSRLSGRGGLTAGRHPLEGTEESLQGGPWSYHRARHRQVLPTGSTIITSD